MRSKEKLESWNLLVFNNFTIPGTFVYGNNFLMAEGFLKRDLWDKKFKTFIERMMIG